MGTLVARLPTVLQLDDSAESLLEAVSWPDYFDFPDSIFAMPDADDRAFKEVPDLLDRVDDDGLVVVAGLDAHAHGLFYGDLSLHYPAMRYSTTPISSAKRFTATQRVALRS